MDFTKVALVFTLLSSISSLHGFDYRFCNQSNQDIEVRITPGGAPVHRCDREHTRILKIKAGSYSDLGWPYLMCNPQDGVLTVNGMKVRLYTSQPGHRMFGRRGDTILLTVKDELNLDGSVKQVWSAHETAYLTACPRTK